LKDFQDYVQVRLRLLDKPFFRRQVYVKSLMKTLTLHMIVIEPADATDKSNTVFVAR